MCRRCSIKTNHGTASNHKTGLSFPRHSHLPDWHAPMLWILVGSPKCQAEWHPNTSKVHAMSPWVSTGSSIGKWKVTGCYDTPVVYSASATCWNTILLGWRNHWTDRGTSFSSLSSRPTVVDSTGEPTGNGAAAKETAECEITHCSVSPLSSSESRWSLGSQVHVEIMLVTAWWLSSLFFNIYIYIYLYVSWYNMDMWWHVDVAPMLLVWLTVCLFIWKNTMSWDPAFAGAKEIFAVPTVFLGSNAQFLSSSKSWCSELLDVLVEGRWRDAMESEAVRGYNHLPPPCRPQMLCKSERSFH